MECALATLIACFSWSNFYIDANVFWQDRGDLRITQYGTLDPSLFPHPVMGKASDLQVYVLTTNEPQNPYVDVSAGFRINPTPSLEIEFVLRGHRSSIATGQDFGSNYSGIEFNWFPFRRHE